MTFFTESPWVIYALAAIGTAAASFVWLQGRDARLLLAAGACVLMAVVAYFVDRAVVTDREFLNELFPRLAQAAEKSDADTLLAAIDPTLRPKQTEAKQLLQQFRPTSVTITDLQLDIRDNRQPITATAEVICRVSGNIPGLGGADGQLLGVSVELRKSDEHWYIIDFHGERPDPFKKCQSAR